MAVYAYICAGVEPIGGVVVCDDAFTILDISDALNPALVGSIQGAGSPNFLGSPTNAALKGKYAFVCSYANERLTVLDISTPATPAFLASLSIALIYDIKIKGTYAFVASYNAGTFVGSIVSIDISDPANPSVADTITHSTGGDDDMGQPVSLYISGNYLYVASTSNNLLIFDISNPESLTYVGYIYHATYTSSPGFVIVDGDYAYLSATGSDSLTIIDVSNPASPTILSNLPLSEHSIGLYKKGDYVYACCQGDCTFQIIDVSDPASPSVASTFDLFTEFATPARPAQVMVRGNYAFVTVQDGENGLLVLDISNPASMSLVGQLLGVGSPNYLQTAHSLVLSEAVIKGNPNVDQLMY